MSPSSHTCPLLGRQMELLTLRPWIWGPDSQERVSVKLGVPVSPGTLASPAARGGTGRADVMGRAGTRNREPQAAAARGQVSLPPTSWPTPKCSSAASDHKALGRQRFGQTGELATGTEAPCCGLVRGGLVGLPSLVPAVSLSSCVISVTDAW